MSEEWNNPELADEVPTPEQLPEVIDLDEIVVDRRKIKLLGTTYEMEDRRDLSFVEAEHVQRLLVAYRRLRVEDGRGPYGTLDEEQRERLAGVEVALLSAILAGVDEGTIAAANDRQKNAVVNLFFADWNNRPIELTDLVGGRLPTPTPNGSTPSSSGTTRRSRRGSSSGTAAASSTGGGSASTA